MPLPVLPIREMVVFPGSMTPFVVGRRGSLLALERAEAGDGKLLLLAQRDARVEEPAAGDLFGLGTVGRIVQSMTLPEGNRKLLVEGLERARVVSIAKRDGMLVAEVETAAARVEPGPELDRLVERVMRRVRQLYPKRAAAPPPLPDDPNQLADLVAAGVERPLAERQELLETFDVGERLARLAGILEGEAGELTMPEHLDLLRHTVATLAYRAAKALRGAPEEFADYRASGEGRTPAEILAHMGDLFDWALGMCDGEHRWHDSHPLLWEAEKARFFGALQAFDARLATGTKLGFPAEKIFQGPIADALTHVGQIAMLRRMAGWKMRGENYFAADIETGRVGAEQADPRVEF